MTMQAAREKLLKDAAAIIREARLEHETDDERVAYDVLALVAERLADVTSEMVEAVAKALKDAEFGYDLGLFRLVDGVSTYRLTYSDGEPPIEFDDMDDAYAHIADKKRLAQAKGMIAAFLSASALGNGGKG